MTAPNVREIVRAYLVEHGYDGLYHRACGCKLNDLFPCYAEDDCMPGVIAFDESENATIVPRKEDQ